MKTTPCAFYLGTLAPVESWKPAVSLVLFLVCEYSCSRAPACVSSYHNSDRVRVCARRAADPGTCTTALSLFNCRALGPDEYERMLVVDATVPCAGAQYDTHAVFAALVTLGLSLLPFQFMWGMKRASAVDGDGGQAARFLHTIV